MTHTDDSSVNPSRLAVALASRLRELRKGTDLSGSAYAAKLGWHQSKVSRIENGRQVPSQDDILAWVRGCDGDSRLADELLTLLDEAAEAQRDWQARAKAGQAAIQQGHDWLGRNASVIRNAEHTWVPGLLQTPGYARARLMENAWVWQTDDSTIEADLMTRMQRQQILYDSDKRFEFVITEAVLRLTLCAPAEMRVQLDRLLSVEGLPNVTLAVIPFGVQLRKSPAHAFILYDGLAFSEVPPEELRYYQPDQVEKFHREMDLLMASAVTGEDARRLILDAMAALDR